MRNAFGKIAFTATVTILMSMSHIATAQEDACAEDYDGMGICVSVSREDGLNDRIEESARETGGYDAGERGAQSSGTTRNWFREMIDRLLNGDHHVEVRANASQCANIGGIVSGVGRCTVELVNATVPSFLGGPASRAKGAISALKNLGSRWGWVDNTFGLTNAVTRLDKAKTAVDQASKLRDLNRSLEGINDAIRGFDGLRHGQILNTDYVSMTRNAYGRWMMNRQGQAVGSDYLKALIEALRNAP